MSNRHGLDDQQWAALQERFAEVAATLTGDDGQLVPDAITRLVAVAIPHAESCGVTFNPPRRTPETLAASDGLGARVDALQVEMDEGPCLDASRSEVETVHVTGDLEVEPRWPAFGPRCAEEIGVRSMIGVTLPLPGKDRAALNLYSSQVDAFTEQDVATAAVLAPYAAIAVQQMVHSQAVSDLRTALDSSRLIGTAVGVLMSQHKITSEEAFERLRTASQALNRKVRDLAEDVAQTGDLPDLPTRTRD